MAMSKQPILRNTERISHLTENVARGRGGIGASPFVLLNGEDERPRSAAADSSLSHSAFKVRMRDRYSSSKQDASALQTSRS